MPILSGNLPNIAATSFRPTVKQQRLCSPSMFWTIRTELHPIPNDPPKIMARIPKSSRLSRRKMAQSPMTAPQIYPASAKNRTRKSVMKLLKKQTPIKPFCKPSSNPIFPVSVTSRRKLDPRCNFRAISGMVPNFVSVKNRFMFSLFPRDKPGAMLESPEFSRQICLLPLAGWSLLVV